MDGGVERMPADMRFECRTTGKLMVPKDRHQGWSSGVGVLLRHAVVFHSISGPLKNV